MNSSYDLFRHNQEVSHLELELESIRDRYKVTSDELASLNEDRVKLTEKVDELRQQVHSLKQDKDSAHRTNVKQVNYIRYINNVSA